MGFADLVSEFLVSEIPLRPVPGDAERGHHLPRIIDMPVRDRENVDLDGCQPEGERTGVMLDKYAEESLEGTHECPMDHDGGVFRPVFPDIRHLEPVRVVEIYLDRRALPGSTEHILDLDVDFRAVEDPFPGVYLVGELFALKGPLECLLRLRPVVRGAGVLFRPGGEIDLVPVEPEPAQHEKSEIEKGEDLLVQLVGAKEQVGVVLGEPTHPHKTVQRSGRFVPVYGSQLGIAHGQVAVGSHPGLVDMDVERAVHRLELVILPFYPDGREHALPVVVEMPAHPPQVDSRDVRGEYEVIPRPRVLFPPEILHDPADDRALGVPEDQPRTDLLVHAEQVELLPEPSVIALLYFLQEEQVFVELLFLCKSAAVDACEHSVPGIAPPVGSRRLHELVRAHPAAAREMRPPAQVEEVPHAVERDDGFRDIGQQFLLVRLTGKSLQRFLLGHLLSNKRLIAPDDLLHLLLDPLEVLRGKRFLHVEIVVEPVFDRGPDGDPYLRKEFLYGRSHHMGSTVPHDFEAVRILGHHPLDLSLRGSLRGKIPDGSVDAGGDRHFCLPLLSGKFDKRHCSCSQKANIPVTPVPRRDGKTIKVHRAGRKNGGRYWT